MAVGTLWEEEKAGNTCHSGHSFSSFLLSKDLQSCHDCHTTRSRTCTALVKEFKKCTNMQCES
eukprot:12926332-Prorocentrum_lima.AAC.1